MAEVLAGAAGGVDRRSLLKGGLLAGLGASVVGAGLLGLPAAAEAASTPNPQPNWWRCNLCDGLFFSNSSGSSAGRCLSPGNGNQHFSHLSSNYSIYNGIATSSDFQAGWAWCNACDLLFWGPGVADSVCFGTSNGNSEDGIDYGRHNRGGTSYGLYHDFSAPGYQTDWKWCDKCQVLFWGPDKSSSLCAWWLNQGYNPQPHTPGSGTSYDMAY